MASDIARAAQRAVPPKHPPGPPVIMFLVTRRVPITIVLMCAFTMLAVFAVRPQPRELINLADPFVLLSYGLLVSGLVLRSWAAGTLHKRLQLATTGPYAMIRHPLYVGSCLIVLGFGTLMNFPLIMWLVLLPLAVIYWLAICSEERHLLTIFPAEWPAYTAAVPRFFPRTLVWPKAADWSLAQWVYNVEYQAWLGVGWALVVIKIAQILLG